MRDTPVGQVVKYNGVVVKTMTTPCKALKIVVTLYTTSVLTVPCFKREPGRSWWDVEVLCDEVITAQQPIPAPTPTGNPEPVPDKPHPHPNPGGHGVTVPQPEDDKYKPEDGVNQGHPPLSSGSSDPLNILIAEPDVLVAPPTVYGSDGREYKLGEVTYGKLYVGTWHDWLKYQAEQLESGKVVSLSEIHNSQWESDQGIVPSTYYDTTRGVYSGVQMGQFVLNSEQGGKTVEHVEVTKSDIHQLNTRHEHRDEEDVQTDKLTNNDKEK